LGLTISLPLLLKKLLAYDEKYSLDETAEAQKFYEQGHTAGKVVIKVS